MMKLSLIFSIIILAVNSQQKIPTWNISVSNNTNKSYGFPTIPVTHYTIYNSTLPDGSKNPNGTYAQGAIITKWKGTYYVSWHNAPQNESVNMRQLYSTSADLISWSSPIEIFPNIRYYGNEENEPFITVNNRLYSSNGFGPNTGDKNNANPALMRQILGLSEMSEIFWLNKTVPNAYKDLGYKTYLEMDEQTIYDMNIYLSSLISNVVSNVTTNNELIWFNERSMYLIPSTKNDIHLKIMLLLRQNCSAKCSPAEYASYCDIKQSKVVLTDNDHLFQCRPGSQNLFWNLIEFVNQTNNSINVPQTCEWTYPVKTNIPDAPSRTCTSTLPNGKIYLLGNQVQYTRDVLVLSTSSDGYVFDKAWAVKYDPPPIKWPGHWKNVGYMYPAGMRDDDNLYVTYDENKENIIISIIALKHIN